MPLGDSARRKSPVPTVHRWHCRQCHVNVKKAFKLLDLHQIRQARICCIFEINGLEVFL